MGLTNAELLRRWKGCITDKDTTLKTGQAIRDFFMDHLAEGHEVIPGSECDNFDFKTGCLGHPEPGKYESSRTPYLRDPKETCDAQ
jgi:hypothetical protein